jgi:hypothetical protein
MSTGNSRESYMRAMREEPSSGVISGARPEPSLDEARTELVEWLTLYLKINMVH